MFFCCPRSGSSGKNRRRSNPSPSRRCRQVNPSAVKRKSLAIERTGPIAHLYGMNRPVLFFVLLVLFCGCHKKEPGIITPQPPVPTDTLLPIRGVDLSFLPEIELNGTVFYDRNGAVADALTIFKTN